jgi:2-polyprenyl-6-methoxyphenol hydroxylase-like FAD-dependent oxidoreductase
MWWTNWAIPTEYTPAEIRDTSDVPAKAIEMFQGRLMYPGEALIKASSLYLKASIFDIQSLPSWHKSRICLIGDAAHAVLPFSSV